MQAKLDGWALDLSGVPDATIEHVTGQVRGYLAEVCAHLGYPDPAEARWLAASRAMGLDANLILVMQRERAYETRAKQWRQFQEWKKNRNPARAALEAQHGYDTKHAGHLVRLLRMGREILVEGEVRVWRGGGAGGAGDAAEILAIRNGEWSYERLEGVAVDADAELEAIYREKRYAVPRQPDREAIEALCVELVERAFAGER